MTPVVLGADPGQHFGWAVVREHDAALMLSGTWLLKMPRAREASCFALLRSRLDELIDVTLAERFMTPVGLAYEAPGGHYSSRAAAWSIYGGAVTVAAWADARRIPYEGVAPKTLKLWATGRGDSRKPDMVAAARRMFRGLDDIEPDQADAILAATRYARTR